MTPDFNVADANTWPMVLTVEHIAAIWHRSRARVNRDCSQGLFIPAPFQQHPRRWRKVDVLRHIEGERGMRRAS